MRRALLALLLPLLVVACASQPKKLAGKYAIELDPWLASRPHASRGTSLQDLVRASLQQQLHLTASAADADAVIVLKRGATDGEVAYEIRRRGDLIVSTEPTTIARLRRTSDPFGDDVERERRNEAIRFGAPVLRPPENFRPSLENPDIARREAIEIQVRRIAEMIVYDLRTKL